MGIFGSMIILTICSYFFLFLLMKIIGSTQKETNKMNDAIQRDTDEFNGL
ncbi:unnamed protein product [Commensalibacter papalotli (ex Botero et al. 2024)]|uniref:Uncharacterized protein n=1 Tax=Commensalibacter papalotli (ex Botero et al. 2024) TaxID=2972766 RepID=A0ABM9HKG9_9PROT|nr:unnamed protein product [Commensalibacter papalotli (ex Botero et al. 2024)]CAI3947738.1 unnamed protein product [Commensalibacter papalotli (ex Botero et al. 2024)]